MTYNFKFIFGSIILYFLYKNKKFFKLLFEAGILKSTKSERLFNSLRNGEIINTNSINQNPISDRRVCIIGAGMSGILAAIKLKNARIPFVIYERAHDIGGTWLFNTYPGCGCDVMSHSYSYSFELNPNWSRIWAKREEIQNYFLKVVEKYNLRENIEFNVEVISAIFYKDQSSWEITTRKISGTPFIVADNPVLQHINKNIEANSGVSVSNFNILIGATGQLNNPNIPSNITGLEKFKGPQFHTARWDSSIDLTNKNVIFIGTGASAIQIVPEIVDKVKTLTLIQRSPGWIVDKDDDVYSPLKKWIFNNIPFTMRLYRLYFFMWMDLCYHAIISSKEQTQTQKMILSALAFQQDDIFKSNPELKKIVIPNERFGCKRLLISNDWYPSIMKNNVKIVPDAVVEVNEEGVITKDTKDIIKGDIIIWATGFKTDKWLPGIHVEARESKASTTKGIVLSQLWEKEAPAAYLGVTLNHFPNLFLLYGPNTNLNHSSIIFQSECEVEHMMRILYEMEAKGYTQVEVRQDELDHYNKELQNNLENTAFASDCNSWYRHNGKITNNWYGSCWEFWDTVDNIDISLAYNFGKSESKKMEPRL